MKTRRIKRILLVIGLCTVALFLMGGGNDCPKPCTIEGAACAPRCGDPLDGTCVLNGSVLDCEGGGGSEQ